MRTMTSVMNKLAQKAQDSVDMIHSVDQVLASLSDEERDVIDDITDEIAYKSLNS